MHALEAFGSVLEVYIPAVSTPDSGHDKPLAVISTAMNPMRFVTGTK